MPHITAGKKHPPSAGGVEQAHVTGNEKHPRPTVPPKHIPFAYRFVNPFSSTTLQTIIARQTICYEECFLIAVVSQFFGRKVGLKKTVREYS
jgi:hypothetical protein